MTPLIKHKAYLIFDSQFSNNLRFYDNRRRGVLIISKNERILWGIFYLILFPIPLLYFYGNNILGLAGSVFLLYLGYYIFLKDHSK